MRASIVSAILRGCGVQDGSARPPVFRRSFLPRSRSGFPSSGDAVARCPRSSCATSPRFAVYERLSRSRENGFVEFLFHEFPEFVRDLLSSPRDPKGDSPPCSSKKWHGIARRVGPMFNGLGLIRDCGGLRFRFDRGFGFRFLDPVQTHASPRILDALVIRRPCRERRHIVSVGEFIQRRERGRL